MSEQQQTLTIQQALDLAVQHHKAGRLSEAESIYNQILQSDPNQPVASHLLGVIAHQTGKNNLAEELITKALTVMPANAEAHSNLGLVLYELGKTKEAIASYQQAIKLKPDYAEAHNNLAIAYWGRGQLEEAIVNLEKALSIKPDFTNAHNTMSCVFHGLGKYDEAVTSAQEALVIKPDFPDGHNNLGVALYDLGKLEDALASYQKALALKSNYPEAHNNLGLVLQDLGRMKESAASCRNALALKPDYAEAHINLGRALQALGNSKEAVNSHRRAISLDPKNELCWISFAISLETVSFTSVDDTLYRDLFQLLDHPAVDPSKISRAVFSALRHHPGFSRVLEATSSCQPDTVLPYNVVAEELSKIPLLLRILQWTFVNDRATEQMLTVVRRSLLEEAIKSENDRTVFPFSATLALQCFTNEYVFAETDDEKDKIERLQRTISKQVEKGEDISPSLLIALGSYRPLYTFPWAQKQSEQEWNDYVKDVIKVQISEPLEERALREQIPSVSIIENTISQLVREQYEENPYPRWVKTDIHYKSRSIGDVLQGAPLRFDLGNYVSPANPQILVAGCGTGRHALNSAARFSQANVLAVDLSLSSLAYAERKTRELGFSNIEYVQGDITELGKIEQRFDLIECVGVLHHLGDPLVGWLTLVDLLKPGGLMNIGLYSEAARQNILRGRSLIAEKGYSTSSEDIRRCRQDIIGMAGDGDTWMTQICDIRDFFSLSQCRDLLFHVQEHRFTLPQIGEALTSLHLKFLGFEIQDRGILRKFRESHPDRDSLTSLTLWHEFELKNPDTFVGMYSFWCKKL